jgi:hypothetical protein
LLEIAVEVPEQVANREKGTGCSIMPILVIEDGNKIAALSSKVRLWDRYQFF